MTTLVRALLGISPAENPTSREIQATATVIAPCAQIVTHSGDARIRIGNTINWKSISSLTKGHTGQSLALYPGDKLYVGQAGSLTLRYGIADSDTETVIALGPNSIFQVAQDPPVASQTVKGFDAGNGTIDAASGSFESQFVSTQNKNAADESANDDTSSSPNLVTSGGAMEMQFPVKNVSVFYPSKNIVILGDKLPLKTSFYLENKEDLKGYFWKIDANPKRPIWSGDGKVTEKKFSKKAFKSFEVPISEAGQYLFFATSQNGRYRSKPSLVTVSSPKRKLLPLFLTSNTALVIP